jgi:PAS domain S-box-containing protein
MLVKGKKNKPALMARDDSTDEILLTIVDACASNVAVLDESGNVLYTSKPWRALQKASGLPTAFGDTAGYFEECVRIYGTPINSVPATLKDDIRQLLVGSETEFEGEYCYRGLIKPMHFAVHAARLNLPNCESRIVLTQKDVLSPADALRRSEQRLSQLLEKTKILVWEAEAETWQFTYVSDQAPKIFGYPLARWHEPDFLALHIHPDDRERALSFSLKQSQVAEQYDFTFRLLSRHGRVIWVHNLVSVTHESGKAKKLRGFMIDITERKLAEEALRDLGGRLIAAQEEERSRVARELHDDVNQRMALLSIELEQIRQDVDKPLSLRRRFKALQAQAQEISADIHRLSYKLHPSKLDHLGLEAAVKSLCGDLSKNGTLKIEVNQKGLAEPLSREVTLCVFRVVQEALRNCIKHSSAQAAQVVLERTGSAIRFSISDNGCGFDMKSQLMKRGLGFVSMRERVRLIGGEMHIYSEPQRGTRIEASVPLKG